MTSDVEVLVCQPIHYLEVIMSLRINHNTSSLNSHRNLLKNNERAEKSLERLSSGLSINRAGDAPASLVASEQMRSQIASLEQAVKNSETSVSMIQTAEGALTEVNNMLVSMRQLAIHAANEGANDSVMLEADQLEISGMISAIDRVASSTEFGARKLLDGSNGVSGTSVGRGLQFVSATTATQSSPDQGYEVTIDQEASKSMINGSTSLDIDAVQAGETLTVTEGGKTASYSTKVTDTVQSAIQNFASAAQKAGLSIDIMGDEAGNISIAHKQYGSAYGFSASSSTAGVLSQEAGMLQSASKGLDLKGKINGEAAIGTGDTMTGLVGNLSSDGLTVRFNNADPENAISEGTAVGNVSVTQNALNFQVGPGANQTVTVSLQNMASNELARGVKNASSYQNLSELDVRTSDGAQDSLVMIDNAIKQVSQIRSELGSFQKNTLETNMATLQVTRENMIAAESTIRDTDMALEMAEYTRNS